MKKYIIILFCAAELSTGCKKFLDENPKGLITDANAIQDIPGLDAALTGAYKGVTRVWARGFLNASTQGFSMGGDDLTTIPGGNKAEFRQLDQFDVVSTNSHIAMIWNGCYKMIQGANNVLANAPKIKYKTPADKAKIDGIVGEAHFLRALGYYWVVRGWGSIPLITDIVTSVTPDILNIKKTEPKDVYKVIESDLAAAESLLPTTKRDPGRPNQGSAKALLADVYLTEAGWPIKDVSKYALSAAKAKEVIDNETLYNFNLVDLSVLWAGNATAIGTKEEVMAFHASDKFGGSTNSFTGAPTTPPEEGGWEDYESEINFFYNFPAGKRKDITFHTIFTKSDGSTVTWQNSIDGHPYYGKFRIEHNDRWYSSMPVHMMRYAHVLLIYAEAQARSEGTPNTMAYTCMNRVRQRAGLPDLTAGLAGAAFADSVVNERAWEFAGEGTTRWFDLQRLELVETANANKNVNDLKPIGAITKDDYWFPIPQMDAQINPNL
ncbi:MAG: RagB/SusD family nutrient uptake outer membrane protein [Chitinophagaceae bacterium]|nr:RagB/SusD family nutrient uptake outer membrane protein [Chitinophagaceae bacterium]